MRKIVCLLMTASALALLTGFITSGHHLGLTEDGLRYISMAKHVAAGKGVSLYNPAIAPVSLPYISQAPLWPLLLAPGLAVGLRVETWSWMLVVLLLAGNLFLAGCTALYATRLLAAGLTAQFLVFVDLHWLTHHAYVLSEPLFLLLTQGTVLALWVFADSRRKRWLVVAVLCAGLAGLARFIGWTYAGAVGAVVLAFGSGGWLRRFKNSLIAGFLSALPLGLWFLRHYLLRREWFGMHVSESQTGQFFPLKVAASFFREALNYPVTNSWLPDWPKAEWIFPALCVIALTVSVRRGQTQKKYSDLVVPLVAGVYAASMIGVWTVRSVQGFPDPGRLLLPMMAHLWVWGLVVYWRFLSGSETDSKRPVAFTVLARCVCVIVFLWGAGRVPHTYGWMVQAVKTGEYGRADAVRWEDANRIAWFPLQNDAGR